MVHSQRITPQGLPVILELASYHLATTLARQEAFNRLVGDSIPEYDPEKGVVSYELDDGTTAFQAQVIAMTDATTQSFMWAWAPGQSWPEQQLKAINDLRAFGRKNQLVELSQGIWHLEDIQPFILAAIARGFCQFDCIVRIPLGELAVFVMLAGVPLPPPTPQEVVHALTTANALVPVDHRLSTMELIRDLSLSSTGIDELVVISMPTAHISIAFTTKGLIEDITIAPVKD